MAERAFFLLEWFRTHPPTFARFYDEVDTPFDNYVYSCVKDIVAGLQQATYETCLQGRNAARHLYNTAQSQDDPSYALRCYEVYEWMCRQLARHLLSGGNA